jgi:glutamate synthase (NADPH/NADH) large chain
VRNSGATAVVEGCGANGVEYMTGGTVVILGPTGDNFGAGMTGGMAFVLDEGERFAARVNPETVVLNRLGSTHWEGELKRLIAGHAAATGSAWASTLLDEWEARRGSVWQVVPREMLSRLAHPLVEAMPEFVAA